MKKTFTIDKIIIIFTVVSAALLQLIDTSIVNVALNQMMGNLGASFEEIGWVITGYAVSNVIMITLSGWMGAKFGRKYYFAASIVLFTVASVLCGMSTNVWELVAFRVLQGIGGGGLLSTAQAILIETFPKEEIGLATAIYGVGVIIGPAVGPTLGGWITDNMSWQWIFYINIPFGILATILTLTYVKEPKEKIDAGKMDWFALVLLIAAIGALQIVLEKGQSEDWFETRYITILTIVAIASAVVFVWRQLVVKVPLINLRLFGNRPFATGTIMNFVLGFGLYASTLIVPVFSQNLLGITALETGLILLPGSIATAITMPIVGSLLKRRTVHPAIYAGMGMIMFFIFTWMMSSLNTSAGSGDFFWPLIIRGVGMGLIFIPLTTISMAALKGKEIPQGTALSNMIRQLGGSVGIALITTLMSIQTAKHYSYVNENVTITDPATQQRISAYTNMFISKGYAFNDAHQGALDLIQKTELQQATMLTYKDVFIYVGLFFIVLIPMLILFRTKKKEKEEEMHIDLAME